MQLSSLNRRLDTASPWVKCTDIRNYVLTNYILAFIFVGHTSFIPVFYLLGSSLCFYNNLLAVAVDATAIYMNYKGRLRTAYILVVFIISYHAFCCQLSFGYEAGFVYYFYSLTVFIFIFRKFALLRFFLFAYIIVLYIIQYLYLDLHTVYPPVSVIPLGLIYFFNAAANFFATAFIATFFTVSADRAEALLLEAKDKAEAGMRAKSMFLAHMSHEIRTPLNSVAGMITLALMSESEEERREYLNIAKDSADHLLTVINDILDFSKIEEKKMELYDESFDIYNLVNNIVKALNTGVDKERVKMSFTISSDIRHILRGDPSRLRQVLINLISNAIKFTDRGSIKINIEQKSSGDDSCVLKFSVSDTGPGVPEESLGAIFESFTQLSSSREVRLKGSGLGLTISRELVKLMGGVITVTSRPGEGSVFSFEIPLKYGETADVITKSGAFKQGAHSGKRILVAEDDVINRLLIEQYLGILGCFFKVVENGRMALAELGKSDYDLVLMDIEMPDMDGVMALGLIRDSPGII
jgi:signal transduction histidine kinase